MNASVVIPVYNTERYVEQAVRSALRQTQVAEILVVDDGSRDGSLDVCVELARQERRVKVLRHADGGNRGAAASRNLGVASATGDFIAFLDADDFMLDGRFDAAEARFVQDPSVDGVYDAVGTVFESSAARDWWAKRHGANTLTTIRTAMPPEQLFPALLSWQHGWFCTDGIVVRKQLFDRTGFFDSGLKLGEDSLMWRKMALVGRLVAGSLDRPVAMRRVHGENTIIRRQDDDIAQNREILRRLLRWTRDRHSPALDRHAIITALVYQMQRTSSHPDRGIWTRMLETVRMLALVSSDPLVLRNPIWRRAVRESTGLAA